MDTRLFVLVDAVAREQRLWRLPEHEEAPPGLLSREEPDGSGTEQDPRRA